MTEATLPKDLSAMGEIARTLESSSLIQQYSLEEESHTSNSGNQYKNQRPLDLSTSEEFIRVAAAIQELVVSSRGQITLGQSFYNLNPLRTIGRGATFSVKALKNRNERLPLHRRIEPGFNELCDGVVYKRLRRFPVASFAERSRQLRMVMLELKALGHPPLVQHENIVKLKGVGFEPDFYGGEDPWPVLLVELADQETLADLQQNTTLSAELKFHLSLDVALGLQAVHNNSIVHGDVKTENVLLFTHDSRQYIAKIGDFGCSILGGNVADYLPRGTFPWQAPEILANQSLTFVDIIKCDIYSFGLLHFRLVNDNISPFDVRYLGKGFQQEDIRVISRKMKLETAKPSLLSHLQHILSMSIEKKVVLDTIFEVLCNTVQASPKDRDLTRAIAGLRAQHVIQTRNPPKSSPVALISGDLATSSGMIFRGLGNSVQKVLFKAFLHSGKEAIEYHSVKSVGAYHDMKAKSSEGVQRLRLEHCISLFEAYLCGYGVNKDPVEGLKWLLRAAKCGLPDAAGDLQNCYEALGLDFRPDDEVKMMLVYSALHGHPGAKEIVRRFDLFQSLQGRELNEWVLEFDLHNVSFPGKVARIAFYNSKLFQRQLRTYLRQPQSQLRDLLLTSQGDNLLQSCILADADLEVIRMVLESGIDVNVANKYGETALLQACRAGNSNIVNTLLKVGADAKAIDSRGCSPLHYICTMTLPEKDFLRLTRILVQGGADIHKMSQEPICLHLEKCLGSPLHFAVLLNNLNAVKAYVSFGAIATLTSVSQFLCSAVEFAASLLYYDILVYLVERTPNLNFDTFFVK